MPTLAVFQLYRGIKKKCVGKKTTIGFADG